MLKEGIKNIIEPEMKVDSKQELPLKEKLELTEEQKRRFLLRFEQDLFNGYASIDELRERMSPDMLDSMSEEIEKAVLKVCHRTLSGGWIERVLEIQEAFSIPPEALFSEKVRDASFCGIRDSLNRGKVEQALKIQAAFPVTAEQIQQASYAGILICLENSWWDTFLKTQTAFPLSPELLQQASRDVMLRVFKMYSPFQKIRKIQEINPLPDEVFKQVCFEAIQYKFCEDNWVGILNRPQSDISDIQKEFPISQELLQQAACEGIRYNLSNGNLNNAYEIQKEFPQSPENLGSEGIQQALYEHIRKNLFHNEARNNIFIVKKIMETFHGSSELLHRVVFEAVKYQIANERFDNVFQIHHYFPLTSEQIASVEIQKASYDGIKKNLLDGKISEALKFKQAFPISDEMLSDEEMQTAIFAGAKNFLENGLIGKYFEFENVFLVNKDVVKSEQFSKNLFEQIKGKEAWSDEQNISGPFNVGAEHFGYKKMFEYLNREGLTLHDGLHNFRKIIKMSDVSGLSADQFYAQILKQVMDDGTSYEEGTAQNKLNSVANNVNLDFDKVLKQIEQYKDIKKLKDLGDLLQDVISIFSSWKNLKKYEELCSLLGRTEILENLRGLRTNGKENLAQYIETLAFHPNVSMQGVMKFWRQPQSFLEAMDGHTPEYIQNQKKPSNYFNIPYLDLSAKELRDALIEGAYDRIQSFPPYEMIYNIASSRNDERYASVQDLTIKALGKRDGSIVGEAKNTKALFSKIFALFKAKKIPLQDFMKSSQVETEFPEADEVFLKEVKDLLFDPSVGIAVKTEEYRMRISEKSDPDAVVAGNDTACCMPFGSGKNNVYTFNPACALLLVQKKNADGVWRTVAQSVITPDKDIKKSISDLSPVVLSGNTHMSEVLDQDILLDTPSVLAFDNIEVAGNFKGNDAILKALYCDFSRRYIAKFRSGAFDRNRAIIGMGYTDAMTSLPKVENTFFPETPVGYSDNLRTESYELDINKHSGEENMIVGYDEKAFDESRFGKKDSMSNLPKGVALLTFRDSLQVAYLEGKAYSSNTSLIQNLHNMENALIAKDVNNSAKGRENMSFSYTGTDNKMHGYLLAYQGGRKEAPFLYIADLASDGAIKAGGSLMKAFAESYRKNYTEKGNNLPLYAQFREQTSYKILIRQIEKLSEEAGVRFIMEERGSYRTGDDTMHEVFIYPEGLKNKERYANFNPNDKEYDDEKFTEYNNEDYDSQEGEDYNGYDEGDEEVSGQNIHEDETLMTFDDDIEDNFVMPQRQGMRRG
jgi:hypothetical protein